MSEVLPFYPLSSFYKRKFGFKLQKIPLTIASTCPNRMGINGMQTCVFCDEWGSSAYPEQAGQDLKSQIAHKMRFLGHHRNVENFLAYFQTYTSTFLGVAKLRKSFEDVLSFPEVKGVIIGTRPDCISDAVIDLINEFSGEVYSRTNVTVELGVQTFSNAELKFLRRGHDSRTSIDAIHKLKSKTRADIGIHLIFGIPGETLESLQKTAEIVNSLNVDHVKIHNLHVLKNTPLAEMYVAGTFKPLEILEYSQRVIHFLKYLDPKISIERLAALSSHWEELVAPDWNRHKLKTRQFIVDQMNLQGARQGDAL